MQIAIVLGGILVLILLIAFFRLNTFLSFIIVAIGLGVALGIPMNEVSKAIQKGIGSTLGFLVIILGFGAMLGKLVADKELRIPSFAFFPIDMCNGR
jgi:H+/gluconate symporter-like permease